MGGEACGLTSDTLFTLRPAAQNSGRHPRQTRRCSKVTTCLRLVDTTRILTFRHPSQAELLLESLVRDRLRAGSHAHIVTDRSELPSALQRIIIEAGRSGKVWSAWSDGHSACGYTGEMLAARIGGAKCAVLQVNSYDHRGRLTSQRVWARGADGTWHTCVRKTSRGPDPVPWPARN
jgi:hypothetical protein